MNEAVESKRVRNGRVKLLMILAIFLVPFVIAAIMHKQYRDGGELEISSNGELVWPAVPLLAFTLVDVRNEDRAIDLDWIKQQWTLVYPHTGECADVCQKNTYHMRQIHVSLGKEAHRVQRLLVADQPDSVMSFIGAEYPSLLLASGDRVNVRGFTTQLEAAAGELPSQPDSLYLVDPLGNVMMRFSPDLNPKGILKDIKRALKASRIG